MKYFIIAGETSGDLHAGNLVQEISKLDENAIFKGVGGDCMQRNNVDLLFGLDRLSFMGFVEVLLHIITIFRNFRAVKKSILAFQPDVVVLVDYPGFNLRMAKWCKLKGFKVAYYISPTIWAWHESRVETIKKYVDLMLCVLPFEPAFYENHQYLKSHFVGHPLLDAIDMYDRKNQSKINLDKKNKCIALLPGSRKQELEQLLPIFTAVAQHFPNEQFVLSGITRLTTMYPVSMPKNMSILYDDMYGILADAKAAVVCSGTATLETALFNIPQVVVYKTAWLNYVIGRCMAKVQFISLPNLIVQRKIVEELIQSDCTTSKCVAELQQLLQHSNIKQYDVMMEKIGEKGASKNAANLIYSLVA